LGIFLVLMFWIRVLSLLPLFFSIALEQIDDIDCKSYVLIGYRSCDLVSFFLFNCLNTSWEYLAQSVVNWRTLQKLQLYIFFFFNCLDTVVWESISNSVIIASLLGLFKYYSLFFQVSLYVFEILFDFNIVNWRLVRITFLFPLL
jgi:hypothetical protein